MRAIGYEAANSYIKVRAQDAPDPDVYFNVLWRVPEEYQADAMTNSRSGSNKDLYKIGNDTYRAGFRVIGEKYSSSSGASADRYRLPQYKNESIIALARNIADGDELNVVTAVPADHFKIDHVHRDIETALRGVSHGVHAVQVGGSSKIFTIKKVRVISQPVAMVISVAYNLDGSIKTPSVLMNRKICVDIGWGTTDIAIMVGLETLRSFSITAAMSSAYEAIYDRLRAENPKLKGIPFTVFDLEAQLRAGDAFEIGGKPYDCSQMKEDAFATLASEIMSEILNRDIIFDQYDMTVFGGGGIEALSEYFKPQLEGINAQKVNNPQQANALGCLIYGLYKK